MSAAVAAAERGSGVLLLLLLPIDWSSLLLLLATVEGDLPLLPLVLEWLQLLLRSLGFQHLLLVDPGWG